MSDERAAAGLSTYLTACADEFIADAAGALRTEGWVHDGEHYVPDESVTEGDVVLVRESDGIRFGADVSVIVYPLGPDDRPVSDGLVRQRKPGK